MTARMRQLVLFAYLGAIGYYLIALLVLVLYGKITANEYLGQTALVLTGLGALLIKTESSTSADNVAVTGDQVTVEETGSKKKS